MTHDVTIWTMRHPRGVCEAWTDDVVQARACTQGDEAMHHAVRMVAADVCDHLADLHRSDELGGVEGVRFTVREGHDVPGEWQP